MKKSVLLFIYVTLLIPAFCLAAPKKQTATKESRSLKAVVKGDGRRVALVIGNGAYKYADSMPKLANPTNDADDIAAVLQRFGFDVVAKKNLSKEAMENAIADFGRRSANSDAALFYYAGHGLQVKGRNYLVPVDARIDTEAQVPYRSVDVNQLLDEMENSKSRVNIVMLDACRNNPISGSFRSGATRGLAPPASSPKGTVIVYATDPGNVAADGDGRNGLFTAGLLTAFKGDDLSLFGVLSKTSEVVETGSNRRQSPYVNGPPSVQKNFYFAPGQTSSPVQPQQVAMASQSQPQQQPVRVQSARKGNLTDPTTGMEFVSVPEGCGTIGNSHVCFDAFSIGKYEVTQSQWNKVMGSNPSHFSRCGADCPVEQVSWNDVQLFISRLNHQSGTSYRLPTEAEWEYACRAGEIHDYCGSNDRDAIAWYRDNSESQTHQVGQKQSNGWGIYDMSGNASEWVQDRYEKSYPTGTKNPTGPELGFSRVIRGGGWNSNQGILRASNRYSYSPDTRYFFLGFRLATPVK